MKVALCNEEISETLENLKEISVDPSQFTVLGDKKILIAFNEELNSNIQYYLTICGTNLFHVASTKVVDSSTLEGAIPDHNVTEVVKLSVCCFNNMLVTIATHSIEFVSDALESFVKELLHFTSSGEHFGKVHALFRNILTVSCHDTELLDLKLVSIFVKLHPSLHLATSEDTSHPLLLHFCATHDLPQLAEHLLCNNGAEILLNNIDANGHTALDIAHNKNHAKLVEVLSRKHYEQVVEPQSPSVTGRPIVKRHGLGTTSITCKVTLDVQEDIKKNLMLLKELETLHSNIGVSSKQSCDLEGDNGGPLAESFRKLQEINAEIRRLKTNSAQDSFDEFDEDLVDTEEDGNLKDFEEVSSDVVVDRPTVKRQTSEVMLNVIEQPVVDEIEEVVPTMFKSCETVPVEEVAVKVSSNQDDDSQGDAGFTKVNSLQENVEATSDDVQNCEQINVVCASQANFSAEESEEELKRTLENVAFPSFAEAPQLCAELDTKDDLREVCDDKSESIYTEDLSQGGVDKEETEDVQIETDSLLQEIVKNEDDKETPIAVLMPHTGEDDKETSIAVLMPHASEDDKETPIAVLMPHAGEDDKETPIAVLMPHAGAEGICENEQYQKERDKTSEETAHDLEKHLVEEASSVDSVVSTAVNEVHCTPLESVMEETEEELNEDTVQRRPKSDGLVSVTRCISELPPVPPKRVGILRRKGIKHDRPLSDSYENLRMVENQGIIDLFHGNKPEEGADSIISRGRSLGELSDKEHEEMSNGSQSSLNKDSQSSLRKNSATSLNQDSESPSTSDTESQTSLHRSDSGKSGKLSVSSLAVSSLSLNETSMQQPDDGGGVKNFKRAGLFSRMSFKKAKSMTSLVDAKDTVSFTVEDRRLTYDFITHEKEVKEETSRHTSGFSRYDTDVKKSQSSLAINTASKVKPRVIQENRRVSTTDIPNSYQSTSAVHSGGEDEDTDEGTSSFIGNRFPQERKSSDEKIKKRFGILPGSKTKDKHKVKESKEKGKKKQKKTKSHAKPEIPAAIHTITDAKSFLAKRGTSFRQNLKSVTTDLKSNADSHKPMFLRNSGPYQSKGENKMKSSERKSPIDNRKASSIEEEIETETESLPSISLTQSQNLSTSRSSIESLSSTNDDTDYNLPPYNTEDTYDSDLDTKDEPETWSELVDKKIQRKMQAKDIKRQDVIYELIQTEALYVRTLNIMSKIYSHAMLEILKIEPTIVDTILPYLNRLLDLNGGFLRNLKERQASSPNFCIENIGDILVNLFDGENGEMMKVAYGYFCSHHLEAVATYKEMLKNDRQFATCMRTCMLNKKARRLSLPECITYVTIRITKYPLLLEAIIKATKDSKPGFETLKRALKLVKEFLAAVDDAVESYEQQKVLDSLKKTVDKRNVVEIKSGNTKTLYKTTKLFHKRSRLVHDKKCLLRGKSKNYEIRMVILADKVIFLQDNGQKFQLLSADNKPPVLSLRNVMVREVATDIKALFLVSTSKDAAQIYEIVCDSYRDKKEFIPKLQHYIKDCPQEDENTTDIEEENKREEAERIDKLKEYYEQLQTSDDKISKLFTEKNKIVYEMRDLIETMDEIGPIKGSPCTGTKRADIENARWLLENCLSEVNSLANTVCIYNPEPPSASPTPSTVNSNLSINSSRADTFGGFESRMKSSASASSVNRPATLRPGGRPVSSIIETDSGKPRRQSQLLLGFGRTRAMGSTEDLSNSVSSLTSVTSALSQITLFQSLRDNLNNLVEATNKQDAEIAKMRGELQDLRVDNLKLNEERKVVEEKLSQQSKDSERRLRIENEKYSKLSREFKRNNDRLNRQLDEKKSQYQKLLETYNESQKNHTASNNTSGKKHQRANSEEVIFF